MKVLPFFEIILKVMLRIMKFFSLSQILTTYTFVVCMGGLPLQGI